MNIAKYAPVAAAFIATVATVAPTMAQQGAAAGPWAQLQTSSAMIGIGGGSGEGQLTLPNLGTNCVYPFTVSGFGAGIQVGISRASAAGPVSGMNRLEDFSGKYSGSHGEATILAGGGGTTVKNDAGVTIALSSQTQGLNIGISGTGVTVSMPVPPPASPPMLVLEFGYNKDWLNKINKAKLDQFLATWKCRYGTIEIVGHTDSVGKEDANLQLSVNRATAVRDYIIGSGLYASRIAPLAAGENNQQVATGQGVRLRANRVVTVAVK
jgi:hypothetical protein